MSMSFGVYFYSAIDSQKILEAISNIISKEAIFDEEHNQGTYQPILGHIQWDTLTLTLFLLEDEEIKQMHNRLNISVNYSLELPLDTSRYDICRQALRKLMDILSNNLEKDLFVELDGMTIALYQNREIFVRNEEYQALLGFEDHEINLKMLPSI